MAEVRASTHFRDGIFEISPARASDSGEISAQLAQG